MVWLWNRRDRIISIIFEFGWEISAFSNMWFVYRYHDAATEMMPWLKSLYRIKVNIATMLWTVESHLWSSTTNLSLMILRSILCLFADFSFVFCLMLLFFMSVLGMVFRFCVFSNDLKYSHNSSKWLEDLLSNWHDLNLDFVSTCAQ